MNLRVVAMLALFGLLTVAVTRSHPLDSANYVEYRASHGGSSWRGRAPVDYRVLVVEGERLELKAVVKSASFDSGNLMRDGFASATVFESNVYPNIIFTASINADMLDGDVQQIPMKGTLSMHGVTKEITALVNLEREGKRPHATGLFEVKLSDYHMARPFVAGVPINDVVTVTFNIELEQLQQGLAHP